MGFSLDSGSTAANILGVGSKPVGGKVEKKQVLLAKQKTGRDKKTPALSSGKKLLQVDFQKYEKRICWFQARVPSSVKAAIKKYADENGISQADFVIGLVEAYGRERQRLEQ